MITLQNDIDTKIKRLFVFIISAQDKIKTTLLFVFD